MQTTLINLQNLLNPNHKTFFQSVDRGILFYGSKGSGKSYSVADKVLLQPFVQSDYAKKDIRVKNVIIRQSLPALKRSCMELLEERAELLKIPYKLNKSDNVSEYYNGSRNIFIGLDDSKSFMKLQSITNVDMVWIEELPEVSERIYENANLILRGGQGLYKQFIGTFNPVSIGSWVYTRWWENNIDSGKILKLKTIAEDNPWIDKEYLDTLKDLEFSNKSLYTVYYLGEWGVLKGIIFTNWDVVDSMPEAFDERIYGLDFGYNNPTALVKILSKDKELFVEQLLYKTHMVNSEVIEYLKTLGIDPNDPIYCDSAEADRIEEIRRAGFNAKQSEKDVMDGLDYCKGQKYHYLRSSSDLIKEGSSYAWKEDKDGKPLDVPVKFQDHLMDAKRYASYTHFGKRVDATAPKPSKMRKEQFRSVVSNLPT